MMKGFYWYVSDDVARLLCIANSGHLAVYSSIYMSSSSFDGQSNVTPIKVFQREQRGVSNIVLPYARIRD